MIHSSKPKHQSSKISCYCPFHVVQVIIYCYSSFTMLITCYFIIFYFFVSGWSLTSPCWHWTIHSTCHRKENDETHASHACTAWHPSILPPSNGGERIGGGGGGEWKFRFRWLWWLHCHWNTHIQTDLEQPLVPMIAPMIAPMMDKINKLDKTDKVNY